MSSSPQKRAVTSYRQRLVERGLARFEVLGLDSDRQLIRRLARRLAENDDEAARLRVTVARGAAGGSSGKGGILAALRRSPLVGAELDIKREKTTGRNVGP